MISFQVMIVSCRRAIPSGCAVFLVFLAVAVAGCSSSSGGGKGLGEACTQDADCANDWCETNGPPGGQRKQCAAQCGSDTTCQAIDPRAVCFEESACYLACSQDSDCPAGAGCNGNVCEQPSH
jgi:hypothetical protein